MIKLQVGTKAFLRNGEGKFLFLKRNTDKYPKNKGNWDIVGGRIEPGTYLIDNLKREIQEETQLIIVSEPKLIFAQDIILGEDKHIVRLSYVADCSGEIILDLSENVEHRWLTVSEMKQQEDLDVYVKEILEKDLIK